MGGACNLLDFMRDANLIQNKFLHLSRSYFCLVCIWIAPHLLQMCLTTDAILPRLLGGYKGTFLQADVHTS